PSAPAGRWQPAGTVLVTGGTGGLGAEVARWLAAQGAERLVLTSRRGPAAPGAAELRADLVALGAEVVIETCDVADRQELAELLERNPVRAVFHTAAVLDDGVLDTLTPERAAAVLAPKALGAWHLHELTAGTELDAFVLFSSAAGTLGSAGQGSYAAANAYLDALVQLRRAAGLPGTSVAWGAWAAVGLAAGAVGEQLGARGVLPMAPAAAITALHRALDEDAAVLLVADLDWQRHRGEAAAPLLAELRPAQPPAADRTPAADDAAELLDRLAGLSAAKRERALVDLVRGHVAAVLAHTSAAAVEPERAFRTLGFDSITALALRNRLGQATGLKLPATLVFDYPTPAVLARHLGEQLGRPGPTPAAAEPGEAAVREALATVSLARLRAAGLLDALLGLAAEPAAASMAAVAAEPVETGAPLEPAPAADSDFDAMDVEALVQRALDGAGA
ncbi:beta-ketoacyl reductase, partial [Kitasatospora sp. LaBMicrA B282]|uniref:beta-ketoacyl reductase n=1 Tax=Kitasatospora sp. LaBMicrA B282 TaxID=3420949 RepID=UPI003D131615